MAMLIKNLNTQCIAATGAGTDINGLYNQATAFDASTNFSAVSVEPTNADVIRAAMSDMNSSYFINANSVPDEPDRCRHCSHIENYNR